MEIYLNGTQVTVCDLGLHLNNTQVMCRQLGFESAIDDIDEACYYASYFESNDTIWFDRISCNDTELILEQCLQDEFNSTHEQDSGAKCPFSGNDDFTPNSKIQRFSCNIDYQQSLRSGSTESEELMDGGTAHGTLSPTGNRTSFCVEFSTTVINYYSNDSTDSSPTWKTIVVDIIVPIFSSAIGAGIVVFGSLLVRKYCKNKKKKKKEIANNDAKGVQLQKAITNSYP